MTDDIGWVDLGVRPDANGFGPNLSRQLDPALDSVGRSAGTRFSVGFKRAAVAGAAGLATAGAFAVKLGVDSIQAASDLEESTNKVSEVFGTAADKVFKFSARASDALGQTNEEARASAATFGIFGKAADLNDRQAAKFSKRMVRLASDLASFNNTDPGQAADALGAALRGESEPIRAYGVLLDEATLKAEALRLGLLKPVKDESKIRSYQVSVMERQKAYNDAVKENGKESLEALKAEAGLGTARESLRKATEGTIGPLTNQQKLLAAQSEIFKQTDVAQGDFARTSDGLANQQRRMAARFEDTKAKLGEGLLPIMNDAAGFLLDKGIPAFEDFADWFNEDGIPAIETFGGFVADAAGHVKDLIGFLNDLPDPAKYAGFAALVGGGAAVKLRGGGGGSLATAGKVLGLTKPIPVFVTNQGFSGGGSGADGGKFKPPSWLLGGGAIAAGPLTTLGLVWNGFRDTQKWAKENPEEANRRVAVGSPFGGAWGQMGMPDPDLAAAQAAADHYLATMSALQPKVDVFKGSLDLVGSTKVHPDLAVPGLHDAREGLADFIGLQIEARRPVAPPISTTSIDRAIEQMRTLNAEIAKHTDVTRGVDNGVPFVHGGGGSTNPRGVNFNGPINVQAHDYGDFMGQMQRRTQAAGLGGVSQAPTDLRGW